MLRKTLTNKLPASCYSATWRDATPLGNGHIGALVYGFAAHERILINHEDLRTIRERVDLPYVADKMSDVRKLLLEEKFYEAQNFMAEELRERGFKSTGSTPIPLCDILIDTPIYEGFRDYNRQLDMSSGEATIEYRDGSTFIRRCFVSRAANAFIMKLEGSLNGMRLSVDIHDRLNATKPFGRRTVDIPEEIRRYSHKDALFFSAWSKAAPRFGAVLRILDGDYAANEKEIEFKGGHSAVFALIPCVSDDIETALNEAYNKLKGINGDYELLKEAHIRLHKALFTGCTFEIGSQEEHSTEELQLEAYSNTASSEYFEKMYAFSRYLMISACDKTGMICSLLGLWHGDYCTEWALEVLDENIEMSYWQALNGNMTDLMLPFFDYFDSLKEDFRENAKKLYACRGMFVPIITTRDSGLLPNTSCQAIHWTAAGAWISQHYYDYYLYTDDTEFLKQRAIPFMKECADFYLDFLTVGDDGYYQSIPSVSPENTPGNYEYGSYGGAHPEVTMNATMDFAAVHELLTNLVTASEVEWIPEVLSYKEALKRIPPYEVNEEGAIREWMHPFYVDRYNHRHVSHLYPLFPGREIQKGDPRCEMIRRATEKRMENGLSEQSSWSLVHLAHVWARLGCGDSACKCLDFLLRCFVQGSLLTRSNDTRPMGIGMFYPPAPVNIDANLGFASAVNEMFLRSDIGRIEIFPAIPSSWKNGSIGTLLACGAIEVDLCWEEGRYNAWFRSKSDTVFELIALGEAQGVLHLQKNTKLNVSFYRDESKLNLSDFEIHVEPLT